MSNEKPASTGGATGQASHVHYSKKIHMHQGQARHSAHDPEIYCITKDGRLLVFKLDSNSNIVVGEFAKFTRALEVWGLVQCESCNAIQFIDLGSSYVDEIESQLQSIDSGRNRRYGGSFACFNCKEPITIEILFNYYASAASFTRDTFDGGSLVFAVGVKDFFKSARVSSTPNYESNAQGSLMHFG